MKPQWLLGFNLLVALTPISMQSRMTSKLICPNEIPYYRSKNGQSTALNSKSQKLLGLSQRVSINPAIQ